MTTVIWREELVNVDTAFQFLFHKWLFDSVRCLIKKNTIILVIVIYQIHFKVFLLINKSFIFTDFFVGEKALLLGKKKVTGSLLVKEFLGINHTDRAANA